MRRTASFIILTTLVLSACNAGAEPQVTTTSSATQPTAVQPETTVTTTTTAPSTLPDPPPARIGIRQVDADGEFYLMATGETWIPRGHNLLVSGGGPILDTPISPGVYDPAWIHEQLSAMSDLGFNVIRVMWEVCDWELCAAPSNGRVRDELLDNATELLEIASEYGIYVWFASNDLPPDSYYSREAYVEGESDFLTTRNVEVYKEYYTDLLEGLITRQAKTDWMFAFDIRNEYVYQLDWPVPWLSNEGTFTAANGETYEMSDPAERESLSADGILYWANEMTRLVKSHLPDALVTMATLTPNDRVQIRGDDDPRWVVVKNLWAESELDFLNIHGIAEDPDALRTEYVMDSLAKPIVTGEFGLGFGFGTVDVATFWMAYWEAASCQKGFDGWLTWHWAGDDGRWPAHTPIVAEALSPALHPDPCEEVEVEVVLRSWRVPVSASTTEASDIDEFDPGNVTDADEETWWSAGAGVPQWLEVDLGKEGPVGRFVLPIGFLTPDGPLQVEIVGRGDDGDEVLLHVFDEPVAPGDVLEAVLAEPIDGIRYVRFNFQKMRDWVIVHDLEVHSK